MSTDSSEYQIIGVYVSPDVREFLDDFVYEHAGVIDLEAYFSVTEGSTPKGDPLGDVMSLVFEEIVDRFNELVQEADFKEANEVDPHSYQLTRLAGDGRTVYEFRDKVEELSIEKGVDARTCHTALFRAAINEGLFEGIDLVVG